VQHEAWDYVFYVEVGGHVSDRPVVTALEAVKRSTKYLKVLGSFPVYA
jgi:chorismate mutase/prephenate dehydratase